MLGRHKSCHAAHRGVSVGVVAAANGFRKTSGLSHEITTSDLPGSGPATLKESDINTGYNMSPSALSTSKPIDIDPNNSYRNIPTSPSMNQLQTSVTSQPAADTSRDPFGSPVAVTNTQVSSNDCQDSIVSDRRRSSWWFWGNNGIPEGQPLQSASATTTTMTTTTVSTTTTTTRTTTTIQQASLNYNAGTGDNPQQCNLTSGHPNMSENPRIETISENIPSPEAAITKDTTAALDQPNATEAVTRDVDGNLPASQGYLNLWPFNSMFGGGPPVNSQNYLQILMRQWLSAKNYKF